MSVCKFLHGLKFSPPLGKYQGSAKSIFLTHGDSQRLAFLLVNSVAQDYSIMTGPQAFSAHLVN